jgi:hypothetical protein
MGQIHKYLRKGIPSLRSDNAIQDLADYLDKLSQTKKALLR